MPSRLPTSIGRTCVPSVVVDAGFALSDLGLLVTMRLARIADIWLPRGLRTMLDNERLYRGQPQRIGGDWLPPELCAPILEEMAAALTPWQRAWSYGRLSTQVNWIGEARFESALPDRSDTGMLPRFEACCAALDERRGAHRPMSYSALDDCARDAVSLAGALQPEPAVILAAAGAGNAAPPLLAFLATAGIAARELPLAVSPLLRDAQLVDALLPFAGGNRRVAALQVIAPGILSMPEGWVDDEWNDDLGESGEPHLADVWSDAFVLWQVAA